MHQSQESRPARAVSLACGIVITALAFIIVSVATFATQGRSAAGFTFDTLWVAVVTFAVIYLSARALRDRSLVMAFVGLTPTCAIGAALFPVLHALNRISGALELVVTVCIAAAVYLYLGHFRHIYTAVSRWSRLQ